MQSQRTDETIQPSPVQAGATDGGRGTALAVYLLYIGGFFVPLMTVIGLVLAYITRGSGVAFSPHFTFQIRLFWRGLLIMLPIGPLYLLSLLLFAGGRGPGLAAFLLPLGFTLWWLVAMLGGIARGWRALNRGQSTVA